jgi:hypothetical protein
MALQKQILEIPFGTAGRQDTIDPTILESTKLLDSDNVAITKLGKLGRRNGFISDRAPVSDLARNAIRQNSVVDILSYGKQYSEEGNRLYTTPYLKTTSKKILDLGIRDLRAVDCVVANGVIYVTAELYDETNPSFTAFELWVWFFDEDTLAPIHDPVQIYAGTTCGHSAKMAVTISGSTERVHIVYSCGTEVYIRYVTSTYTLSTPILIEYIDANHASGFDVTSYDYWVWVTGYHDVAGQIWIYRLNHTHTTAGSYTVTTTGTPYVVGFADWPAITIAHDHVSTIPGSANVLVMYGPFYSATPSPHYWVGYFQLDADLNSAPDFTGVLDNSATVIKILGISAIYSADTAGYWRYVYTYYAPSVYGTAMKMGEINHTTGALGWSQTSENNVVLRHHLTDNGYFGASRHCGTADDDWVCANFTFNLVLSANYEIFVAGRYNEEDWPGVYPVKRTYDMNINAISHVTKNATTGIYIWATMVLAGYHYGTTGHYAIAINTFKPDALLNSLNVVGANDRLYINGSVPVLWDGNDLMDIGLPRPLIAFHEAKAGGGLSAGTYLWAVIFETTMPSGVLMRSPVSPIVSQVVTATQKEEITIYTTVFKHYMDTIKYNYRGAIRVVLYRTLVNGTILYRVPMAETVVDQVAAGYRPRLLLYDTYTDVQLAGQEALYTTGTPGPLENYQCPPADWVEMHQSRLWAIHSESGDICYSKEIISGEGPAFNPMLIVSNTRQEKPIALKSCGNNLLIVFYRDAVWAITGSGPDDLGQGGTYALDKIANDCGLLNSRSLIETAQGVFYVASSGIHMIPAGGGSPINIGTDITDDINKIKSTIFASVHNRDKNEIRWLSQKNTGSAPTDGITVLCYNYLFKVWHVWHEVLKGYAEVATIMPADSYVLNDIHRIAFTAKVLKESSTDYFDYDSPSDEAYNHYAITPWISLAGKLGVKRVWRGEILLDAATTTDFTCRVSIYIDYNDTAIQTTDVAVSGATDYYPLIAKFGITEQKCSAIKFKIEIIPTTEADVQIKDLRLEYGVLPGSARYLGRVK